MAAAAAWRMWGGVSKSGSPTTRFTIDLPWRRSSLARSAAEVLGEGLMRRTRAAMREVVTRLPGLEMACTERYAHRPREAKTRLHWSYRRSL